MSLAFLAAILHNETGVHLIFVPKGQASKTIASWSQHLVGADDQHALQTSSEFKILPSGKLIL